MDLFSEPLSEVAGYYTRLAEGLRTIGVDCDAIFFQPHPFSYAPEARIPLPVRWIRRLDSAIAGHPGRWKPVRLFLQAVRELAAVAFLVRCLLRYDAFIFAFGQTLLHRNLDLPVLRLFGKRVVVMLGHGSECRPAYVDGSLRGQDRPETPDPHALVRRCRAQIRMIRRIERRADVIVGARLSTFAFARRSFVNGHILGIPAVSPSEVDAGREVPVLQGGVDEDRPIRVLHAPSHPVAKGSARIRAAIDAVRQRGIRIELTEITGRPHAEVVDALRRCDFVVDQVYSDTPLAGLATEAASFGKPTVVGGYGLSELLDSLPGESRPPSMTCHPDALADAVFQLAKNPDERRSLGELARRFVRGSWSATETARRFVVLLRGDPPEDWMISPGDVRYLQGFGLAEEDARANVRSILASHGVAGLGLSHRPDLERAYVAFAAGEPS